MKPVNEQETDKSILPGGDFAIVTGASRDNRLAMAKGLAAAGAAVALLDVDGAAGSREAQAVAGAGGRAVEFQLDVTEAGACADDIGATWENVEGVPSNITGANDNETRRRNRGNPEA